MVGQIRFSEEAEEDIVTAYNWYQSELQGLGDDFVIAINDCLQSILTNPKAFGFRKGKIRGCSVKRFPHLILFLIERRNIYIISVFHTSRNPRL